VRIIELQDMIKYHHPLTEKEISELVEAYQTVLLVLKERFKHAKTLFFPNHRTDHRLEILEEMEKICNHYKGTISMLLKVEDPYNVDPSEVNVNLYEKEHEVLIGWLQYVSCHRLAFIASTLNRLS
jgi:hypothetical protein